MYWRAKLLGAPICLARRRVGRRIRAHTAGMVRPLEVRDGALGVGVGPPWTHGLWAYGAAMTDDFPELPGHGLVISDRQCPNRLRRWRP